MADIESIDSAYIFEGSAENMPLTVGGIEERLEEYVDAVLLVEGVSELPLKVSDIYSQLTT